MIKRVITNRLISLARKLKIAEMVYRAKQQSVIIRWEEKEKKSTRLLSDTEAEQLLQAFYPEPMGTSNACNFFAKENQVVDLQIIIPVYNIENYVSECLDSILSQETHYSIKLVIVDDGSTDNSGRIIDSYKDDSRVKIIHQENKGLSGARNTGLKEIFGKYLMFVDSDDILCEGAIDVLMDVALTNDADIVQGSYVGYRNGHKTRKTGYSMVKRAGTYDLMGFAWGKVYRANLFEHHQFPEGFWFEDTVNSFIIHPLAKSIWVIPDIVYKYRVNQSGITQSSVAKPKSIDTFWITRKMMSERRELGIPEDTAFVSKVRRQILSNASRVAPLSEDIRYAIYRISSILYIDTFDRINAKTKVTDIKDVKLYQIMKNSNYADFELARKWIL